MRPRQEWINPFCPDAEIQKMSSINLDSVLEKQNKIKTFFVTVVLSILWQEPLKMICNLPPPPSEKISLNPDSFL